MRQENRFLRLQIGRIKSTTERLLTLPDDELSRAYDSGKIVDFWLSPQECDVNLWPGEWEKYEITDSSRKEGKTIQPAINSMFQPNFPESSLFEMVNTSNGWNRMTQDATLFLKGHSRVELSIGAIFEWVGQDESPFPSKRHKAKFIRDCMRLYSRCGHRREVQGVITDLSRIVAVKLVSVDENLVPEIQRTAVLEGKLVREVLSRFAFASSTELSVSVASWMFGQRHVHATSVLGSGLHGKVFSVASSPDKFVKEFETISQHAMEKRVLDALAHHQVPYIPKIVAVSNDGKAFLASPVCSPLRELRGQAMVWGLATKYVQCLQQAHNARICHRDVRPENMGFVSSTETTNEDIEVLLFDWASGAEVGSSVQFVGTVHYAAMNVLTGLIEKEDVVPDPAHDLESLVYSIWDITRPASVIPDALCIQGSLNSPDAHDYLTNVMNAWRKDATKNPALAELLSSARACNYEALKTQMAMKS